MDITLRQDNVPYTNRIGAITNSAFVRQLLSVMAKSSSGSDHKCGEVGWFDIGYDNGKTRRIKFLPGHDTERYEYRTGVGVRRMNRGQFFQVLHNAGIPTNAFPRLDE